MKFEVEERFILIEKALHARVNEHKTEKTSRLTFVRSMENPNKNTLLVVLLSYKKVPGIPQYVHTVGNQYLVVRTKMYSYSMKIYHDLLFEVASRSQSSVCTTQMLNCSFLFYSCNQYVYQ